MKVLRIYLSFFICIGLYHSINAQKNSTPIREGEYYGTTSINGHVVKILIIDGDTLPVADMEGIQVTQKRNFKNRDERKRYKQWRKYAAKVYPYAAEAIRLYRDVEEATQGMKKGKKRKYGRKKEKELKPKYTEELKKLTKSQGYILIKMVERELNKPFFDVVVQLEGRWKAMQWQALGRWYGYNLKKGYTAKDDLLLESILQDLNITYGTKPKS
ncbi:DUF4294 domain-containing protein [Aureispira anguillae]|uniref:DUF4294 domain-containing protein n=1 Tax=Aureispira anguillae TaxID=2864201 RepID=A0A915YK54_9BACT|nr:DUF4294 domain-containing protein [Aureispira anguillae]BDS14573.1 DUF4294 domain-containing protein [Aureispira anguillae]